MTRTAKNKRADIWMPLYIADYLADTTHLSTEEHGAYLLLLMHAWTNDGCLPTDDDRLRRITRMDAKAWKLSGNELKSFFFEQDGQLRHQRIDSELIKARGNVEQRSAAGKASAEKRRLEREARRLAEQNEHENGNENSTTVATDVERDPERNGKPSPPPTPTTSLRSVVEREPRTRSGPMTDPAACPTTAPADLTPTPSHRGLAINMHLDLQNELGMFLANARSKGKLSADWNAEFEMWLRRSRNFGNGKDQQPAQAKQSRQEAIASACDTLGVGSQYLNPQGGQHVLR